MSNLGERIRDRRLKRNLTMTELAEAAGVSLSYLSQLERGDKETPSADILFRIATALGTTMAHLAKGEETFSAAPQEIGEIPASLREFWKEHQGPLGLVEEDLRMLASIRYRGKQPTTSLDWLTIYNTIRRMTD